MESACDEKDVDVPKEVSLGKKILHINRTLGDISHH